MFELGSWIEPGSPALQVDSLPTELSGKPIWHTRTHLIDICHRYYCCICTVIDLLDIMVSYALKTDIPSMGTLWEWRQKDQFRGYWAEGWHSRCQDWLPEAICIPLSPASLSYRAWKVKHSLPQIPLQPWGVTWHSSGQWDIDGREDSLPK